MAASGVILNFFIATHFGIEALGVFNQIYAVFVVAAHFAVMGIHHSAQKHISELDDTPQHLGIVSAAALLLATGFGLIGAAGIFALSHPIGRLASSEPVGMGIALAAPGLMFFAINKVLMGVLNGGRRMKEFAGAQSLRVLVILISCLGVAWFGQPPYMLGLSFTIAEVVLLALLLYLVRPQLNCFVLGENLRRWIRIHFRYGTRALINGFLAESYLRIDVIMLGIFVSDRDVGIYSFAALFIEGLFQVPVVFRTLANPELARLLKGGDKLATGRFCRKVALMSVGVFVLAAAAVLVVYPYLGPYFPDDLVSLSYPVLLVLISGLLIYSTMVPMDYIILQGGQAGLPKPSDEFQRTRQCLSQPRADTHCRSHGGQRGDGHCLYRCVNRHQRRELEVAWFQGWGIVIRDTAGSAFRIKTGDRYLTTRLFPSIIGLYRLCI